jgi:hypothetical protein
MLSSPNTPDLPIESSSSVSAQRCSLAACFARSSYPSAHAFISEAAEAASGVSPFPSSGPAE